MRERSRATPYLVLGAAVAAFVGALCWGIVRTFLVVSGTDRLLIGLLAALAVLLAGWFVFHPSVRDAEVSLARPLLGIDLPPVRDYRSRDSRVRGAIWAMWVLLVGAAAAVALLGLLPQGVLLIASGGGTSLLWRLPTGLLLVLAAFVIPTWCGQLLVRTAPRLLGPTPADRLAEAHERERQLAQDNALARELHDGIGHALTAIDVQAQAGLAAGTNDAAYEALSRIRGATGKALGELDQLLGVLRERAQQELSEQVTEADLRELVASAATSPPSRLTITGAWDETSVSCRAIVFRVVQEGMTNAVRHGAGGAQVGVQIDATQVRVEVDNRIGSPGAGGGRGLIGLRERLRLADGELSVESEQGRWRLRAVLPR